MRRRSLICGLATTAMIGGGIAFAQPPGGSLRRIGRLAPLSWRADAPFLAAVREGLVDLGWHEGRDFVFEARYASGDLSALPALAQELVDAKVDVVLAGSNPGVAAIKTTTSTTPIVMVTTGDPVAGGLVASLAAPAGNVTGVTALGQGLGGKRLEILHDAFPSLRSVAVLLNPSSPDAQPFLDEIVHTAKVLGITLSRFPAGRPKELDSALSAAAASGADAIFVLQDGMFIDQRRLIVELVARTRLPAIYGELSFVRAGGLMFYGASLRDMYRQSASYIDKILRGAIPRDLPVQQPTHFSLAVNMKMARSQGLKLTPTFLLRADEVIE